MKQHLDTHRRQQIIRAAIIGSVAILAMFVAAAASVIPLQNAQIGALQQDNQRRVDENRDLTKIIKATQEQYKDLFTACQSSVECLSKAPAPTLVQSPTPSSPGATDAQVSRQIEIYCAAHNDCAGPAGANGVGTNGQNGSDGAPGADSTIPGPQGAPGADGRGIASTVCDDSGEWQVTYTDGSTQDAGSCRMSLINP
jgi:hypothetical protein